MALFFPDVVLPRDAPGFGLWLTGHFLEHQQFIALAAALTPPQVVPYYDFLAWSDEPARARFWLDLHAQVHVQLDRITGTTNIDFSAVDLSKDDQWFVWHDDHRLAHAGYRSFFGVS